MPFWWQFGGGDRRGPSSIQIKGRNTEAMTGSASVEPNGLIPSMSRRGNCWDNAVAESFFSSLKKEHVKKKIYKNRSIAHAAIAEYIEAFYNPTRRHSHLGGVSPANFEAAGSRR
jgi:transposase InsO family protein